MKMRPHALPLLLVVLPLTESLLVVPSSPQCAQLCGNTLSDTSGSEMTCHDSEYATSAYGATFKACIDCELASTYYDTPTREADLQWAIYNVRYALSWCLFGFDNNTNSASTPCLTSFSCAPLRDAIEYDSMNQNTSTYDYCPEFTAAESFVHPCSECLREIGNENYIANFITVLDATCTQQPALGSALSLQGEVFSSQTVNITIPSATPLASYHPSTSILSLGAKIGIVVGGIIVLLILTGCCIVWRGKRRRRAGLARHQRASGYADWQAQASAQQHHQGTPYIGSKSPKSPFFESPASQRPLTRAMSWDQGNSNSPRSAQAEKAYFSPYSSNYTSPVSAVEGLSHAGSWPMEAKPMGLGMGLEEPRPWETQKEGIEMADIERRGSRGGEWQQAAPPIIQPPQNGRNGEGWYELDQKTAGAF